MALPTTPEGLAGCWCGNIVLKPFSPDYELCGCCDTLVVKHMPGPEISYVSDDQQDFYGREYWFSRQTVDLGYPDIMQRARADLPARCLHWLNALLKYRTPPGRILELGSGHGGFVALLRWAGFDASGLELSPWVVQFARDTFQIPVLLGPIEQQKIESGSLDIVALMDVLEHLPDPVVTMRRCLDLLKPDGILLIQTPCFPTGRTFDEMIASQDPFLEMLKPEQHLMLFSRASASRLFAGLGAPHVQFEPAIFSQYDMFLTVSRVPLLATTAEQLDNTLAASPAARLIRALLDLRAADQKTQETLSAAEADRAARLAVIEQQGRQLGEIEAERNLLGAELRDLKTSHAVSEADRAARLTVIEEQGRRLGETEAERNLLGAELRDLKTSYAVSEADRAARLTVIEEQGRRLGETEAERHLLCHQLQALQAGYNASEADRAARAAEYDRMQAEYRAFRRSWRRFLPSRLEPNSGATNAIMQRPKLVQTQEATADTNEYVYQPPERIPDFQSAVSELSKRIQNKIELSWVDHCAPGIVTKLEQQLETGGIPLQSFAVDASQYARYYEAAGYAARYPGYYVGNVTEKSFEHFIAFQLLTLGPGDVLIDVASEGSPIPEIAQRLYGADSYAQDIMYPEGLEGKRIGGDACNMRVPAGFASAVTLTCSLEHFEADADVRLFSELGRVLRPGGKVVVIPLYLYLYPAVQTDPTYSAVSLVPFDEGAIVHCAEGWGNRHGRFYSVETLRARIISSPHFRFTVYRLAGFEQIPGILYSRFVLVAERI